MVFPVVSERKVKLTPKDQTFDFKISFNKTGQSKRGYQIFAGRDGTARVPGRRYCSRVNGMGHKSILLAKKIDRLIFGLNFHLTSDRNLGNFVET